MLKGGHRLLDLVKLLLFLLHFGVFLNIWHESACNSLLLLAFSLAVLHFRFLDLRLLV